METSIPSLRRVYYGVEARWWIVGCIAAMVLVCCLCLCLALVGVTFLSPTRSPGLTPNPIRPIQPSPTPRRPASNPAAPVIDRPAPDFVLKTLDGQEIALSSLQGQPVLVNFWATWCPPCRAEMPAIQRTFEQYRAQGFVVL